jgi:hypothetical protein
VQAFITLQVDFMGSKDGQRGAIAQSSHREPNPLEATMKAVHSALIHRLAAAIAASATTLALFSAVVAISEPHRSALLAAAAARHATHARAQAVPQQVVSIAEAGKENEIGQVPTQRTGAGQAAAGHVDRDGG